MPSRFSVSKSIVWLCGLNMTYTNQVKTSSFQTNRTSMKWESVLSVTVTKNRGRTSWLRVEDEIQMVPFDLPWLTDPDRYCLFVLDPFPPDGIFCLPWHPLSLFFIPPVSQMVQSARLYAPTSLTRHPPTPLTRHMPSWRVSVGGKRTDDELTSVRGRRGTRWVEGTLILSGVSNFRGDLRASALGQIGNLHM